MIEHGVYYGLFVLSTEVKQQCTPQIQSVNYSWSTPWDFAFGDPIGSYCPQKDSSQGHWGTQTPPPRLGGN